MIVYCDRPDNDMSHFCGPQIPTRTRQAETSRLALQENVRIIFSTNRGME